MASSGTFRIFLLDCGVADFENQGAHHLAKLNDPDGKRTIGEYFRKLSDNSLQLYTFCTQVSSPSLTAFRLERKIAGSVSYEMSTRLWRMDGTVSNNRALYPWAFRGQRLERRKMNIFP